MTFRRPFLCKLSQLAQLALSQFHSLSHSLLQPLSRPCSLAQTHTQLPSDWLLALEPLLAPFFAMATPRPYVDVDVGVAAVYVGAAAAVAANVAVASPPLLRANKVK